MRKEISYLVSAQAWNDYRLFLEFADGVSGIVDLKSRIGKGIFQY